MEWVWRRGRKRTRQTSAAEFEAVLRLVDDDVTSFAEALQRFDREVEGRVVDEETQATHQAARDALEFAQHTRSQVSDAEGVGLITDRLADGHYALGCAQAHVAGQRMPEQRVVCFFNPQHGLAATDVVWNRPGHGARRVPACSQDAERVGKRSEPEVRTVQIGARTVPYWTAGAAFLPYTSGYFAGVATLSWALQPAVFGMASTDPGYFGTGIVGSSGNFDGGGFDGSGGGT